MSAATITVARAGDGAKVETMRAGEGSLTKGMAVYRDTSDGMRVKKADADAQASAKFAGILLTAGGDEDDVLVLTEGDLVCDGLTQGTPYFVHTTAGGIGPIGDLSSGDYVSFVGIAISSTLLRVRPLTSDIAI